MSERRTTKRRHLIYYLQVWDIVDGVLLGHVADISPDGVMLISERPIQLGRQFELEIRRQAPEQALTRVRFPAMSRWCRNDVNDDFYDIGFELLDQSSELLITIQTLIKEHGFHD